MALEINGAKFKSAARENAISRPRNGGDQNGFVHYCDRLQSSVVFCSDRRSGDAVVTRSCRSPFIKCGQQARQGRNVSCSHFASAFQRRGIFLSTAKDVFAATRGVARGGWVNPGSR